MRKILIDQRIVARDQNKVFVERANRRPLAPREAERTWVIARGKGNAYVEFDAEPGEVLTQPNPLLDCDEWCLVGDVDLTRRNAEGVENV